MQDSSKQTAAKFSQGKTFKTSLNVSSSNG